MTNWRDEIEELHDFFEGWMRGDLPDEPASLARMEEALAPDFTFVTTAGEMLGREAVVEGVRSAHGARPGLRIEIREPRLLQVWDDRRLAVYEEWQHFEGSSDGRISTVLLCPNDNAPRGLAWVHVHETRIEETDRVG